MEVQGTVFDWTILTHYNSLHTEKGATGERSQKWSTPVVDDPLRFSPKILLLLLIPGESSLISIC